MDTSEQTEGQQHLSRRLLDGDDSVLKDILEGFGPLLQKALRHRFMGGLNYHDIEDVIAFSLWKLWENRDAYDPEKSDLKKYILIISINRSLDIIRARVHGSHRLETYLEQRNRQFATPLPPSTDDPIGEGESDSKMIKDLMECVERLPEKWRQIIWSDACSSNGVSPSQLLSKDLRLSQSSIRVYRKSAMDQLRRYMEEKGYPSDS